MKKSALLVVAMGLVLSLAFSAVAFSAPLDGHIDFSRDRDGFSVGETVKVLLISPDKKGYYNDAFISKMKDRNHYFYPGKVTKLRKGKIVGAWSTFEQFRDRTGKWWDCFPTLHAYAFGVAHYNYAAVRLLTGEEFFGRVAPSSSPRQGVIAIEILPLGQCPPWSKKEAERGW